MRKRMILSICLLLLGIFIYFIFNGQFLIKDGLITSFIRNYVPDILWTLSFYFASINFSKKIVKNYIPFTALYVFLLALLFELLQLVHIINGTFDIFDIIIYFISICIASLIEKIYWREKI